jgi:hypothetical protein
MLTRLLLQCRASGSTRALLVTDGALAVTEDELRHAVTTLATQGCPPSFKLACVAPRRDTFEMWARVEDAGLRGGLRTRVFFEEKNAVRWLEL